MFTTHEMTQPITQQYEKVGKTLTLHIDEDAVRDIPVDSLVGDIVCER